MCARARGVYEHAKFSANIEMCERVNINGYKLSWSHQAINQRSITGDFEGIHQNPQPREKK
jgi:hypothetical protein